MKKPDPGISRLLIDRFELVPKETVFVDDFKKNIEVAESFGILHGQGQQTADCNQKTEMSSDEPVSEVKIVPSGFEKFTRRWVSRSSKSVIGYASYNPLQLNACGDPGFS